MTVKLDHYTSSDRSSAMNLKNLFNRRRNEANESNVPGILSRKSSSKISSKSMDKKSTSNSLVPPSFPAPTPVTPTVTLPRDDPPPYTTAVGAPASRRISNASDANSIAVSTEEDPYAFLSSFDTVFLIDDSGSMAGRSWKETADALATIAPICAAHDNDGVDVVFMNTRRRTSHQHLRSADDVRRVFASARPSGATPTGATLDSILRPYLRDCEARGWERVKPLNIIVITDGVATDDPESVIVQAARRLEKMTAPAWQVGVQFFQVGREPGAAEALAELDDGLVDMGCPRDIVDTVPWKGQLSANSMLKVVLGAVNRKLDRRRNSGDSQRR